MNINHCTLAAIFLAATAAAAPLPPVITTTGTVDNAGTRVTMLGEMVNPNSTQAVAYCFWGQADGVTNFDAWAFTNDLGICQAGSVSNLATDLELGTNYYFRFAASNENGWAWSTNSLDLQTPEVTVPASAGITHGPFYSYYTDTNAATDTLFYSPGRAGVYLFGNSNSVPAIWISIGATPLDWAYQTGSQGQPQVSALAQIDQADSTTTTLYSASYAGQWLFGKTLGTNSAWAARATGTNDWMLIR